MSWQRLKQVKATAFNEYEQEAVKQSWHATMDHIDEDVVVASPDFEDPRAHFALCTDASDFAVGGVLMQWQRPVDWVGPPTPKADEVPVKGEDPLDSKWRADNGYKLAIIGYYSKTLNESQRNYPIYDKEAGAMLLCVRHWSDLISYHPTTVYTDSSVAASMLTKHAAPPRLQRWGLELGSYLPHLKVAFRRGSDNGMADLLSRYQIFKEYVKHHPPNPEVDTVTLPDDLFDKIGDAPLFNPAVLEHKERRYLATSTYELVEPKLRCAINNPIWNSPDAPPIPGRGVSDKLSSAGPDDADDHDADGEDVPVMMVESLADRVTELETYLCHIAADEGGGDPLFAQLHVLGV